MTDQNRPADDSTGSGELGERPVGENLVSKATWTRLLFMVICYALISIASFVCTFVVILGFLWVLFSGEVNRQLQQVGQSLASYVYEIIRYLTFNSEVRPYPLGGEWPSGVREPR